MKSREISRSNGLDNAAFEAWLKTTGYTYRTLMMGGLDIAEGQNINHIVANFRIYQTHEQERIAAENLQKQQAEAVKQQAVAGMLITSGFSFDGFTITKYSGYISGDDVVQIERGREGFWGSTVTDVGEALMISLAQIRRNALAELKEAAYHLGCNAVIGVDFDYLTLDPETVNSSGATLYMPYVFGVTANGNAVIIEKD